MIFTKTRVSSSVFVDDFFLRGNEYYEKGLYDEAITDYTKALKIDPNHVSAWYNRGLAYKAIADYTKALEINPNYTNALWHRGVAYLKKGLFEEAIADSKKFISLQFPDELSENLVGYFRRSDIEEAALFTVRLMNKGFYASSIDGKSEDMLICPSNINERSVLFFDKLHIGKTISRHLRQNKDRYELRFDETDEVFEHIIARSYERYNDTLQESNLKIFRALRAMDGTPGHKGLPRPVSFALYKDGRLAAGECGVIAGRVYSSYSGYYEPDAPSAGLAQIILMARYLEKHGFAFLDFGPPAGYAYKDRLGAVEMSYTDFKTLFLNSI